MPVFDVQPVAWVRNARTEPLDDDWDAIVSDVELADGIPADCLAGLDAFSHVEIVFLFDRVRDDEIVWSARHPRNNPAWPRVGMLAQRGKNRPTGSASRSRR
jgi:tRNA (adenine37-N6)-methyltransferase